MATFNRDNKFDIQLSAAKKAENKLAQILENKTIELKTESWQWERTGNICVEYRGYGKPSGIAATQADYWCHELRRDGETLVYLLFPIERLKEIARKAYHNGGDRKNGGDNSAFDNIVIPLRSIFK